MQEETLSKEFSLLNKSRVKKVYLFRKIFLPLVVAISLLGIILSIYGYVSYFQRIAAEYKFFDYTSEQWDKIVARGNSVSTYVKSLEIKEVFIVFNSLALIFWVAIFVLSLLGTFGIYLNKNNGYFYLKYILIFFFINMIIFFFIIAFQPNDVHKDTTSVISGREINFSEYIKPARPNYSIYWLQGFTSTLFFILSFFAKSNHGFLKNDSILSKEFKK